MPQVVGDFDFVVARGDNLLRLLLQAEEVARIASVPPRPLQNLRRELEYNVRTEVRPTARRVNPLRVGCLQDVIRCSPLPMPVEFLRLESPLVEDDVAPRHARSRRTVTHIVGSHAGVDRRRLQFIGEPQGLIHRVREPPKILHRPLGPVAVSKRVRHAPNAALRVAAHAVFTEQRGRIPRAPVRGDVARPVNQPGVDFRRVVVNGLLDRLHRVAVRRRVEQAHFHLVRRLVRFHAQIVRLAGLELASHKRAEGAVLLVGPLVDVPAFLVGVDGNRPRNHRCRRVDIRNRVEVRKVAAVGNIAFAQLLFAWMSLLVEADTRAHQRFDELEIRAQKLRL